MCDLRNATLHILKGYEPKTTTIYMRCLILLLFFFPAVLFAQEGTVEYSMRYEMEMPPMETIMANLPPDMPIDSTMVAQMMQQFSGIPEQFRTLRMYMDFSGTKSLMRPDLSSFPAGMNPFGGEMPLGLSYTDHLEGTVLSQMPSFDEKAPYLISQNIETIDWSLVDADSTILDYPVKKAEFLSDTLNVVAWYSTDFLSMAGPLQFGGLPGLPLLIETGMQTPQGFTGSISFVAVRLEEGLKKELNAPEGIRITPEEYLEIMSEKMNSFR